MKSKLWAGAIAFSEYLFGSNPPLKGEIGYTLNNCEKTFYLIVILKTSRYEQKYQHLMIIT